MTRKGFNEAMSLINYSETHWVLDQRSRKDLGIYLFFKGGISGRFIEVSPDGTATLGQYDGALPSISDAMFTPSTARRLSSSADESLKMICQSMGPQFLFDFLNPYAALGGRK